MFGKEYQYKINRYEHDRIELDVYDQDEAEVGRFIFYSERSFHIFAITLRSKGVRFDEI